jgi:hypothetical protein
MNEEYGGQNGNTPTAIVFAAISKPSPDGSQTADGQNISGPTKNLLFINLAGVLTVPRKTWSYTSHLILTKQPT